MKLKHGKKQIFFVTRESSKKSAARNALKLQCLKNDNVYFQTRWSDSARSNWRVYFSISEGSRDGNKARVS